MIKKKNDVFDARMKIKRRMQCCLGAKMTKRCVNITCRSDIVEKEVKGGRIRPLPGVSHTWVKAHVRRQDPAYADPSPRT